MKIHYEAIVSQAGPWYTESLIELSIDDSKKPQLWCLTCVGHI